jgi:hypothetical protein
MSIKDDVVLMAGLGVGLLLVVKYLGAQAADAANSVADGVKAAVPYVDPTDPRNVVYQTVSAPFGGSLGGALYDLLH